MPLQVACPQCKTPFVVNEPEIAGGEPVQCPKCRQPIRVRAPAAAPSPALPPGPPASPSLSPAPTASTPVIGSPATAPKISPPAAAVPAASKTAAPPTPVKSPAPPNAGPQRPASPDAAPLLGKMLDSDQAPAAAQHGAGWLGLFEPLLRRQSPTDPSMLLTFLVGLALTVGAYWGIFLPMRQQYWALLFTDRGWVPYAVVFLTSWSMAILVLKLWKLTHQQRSLTYDLLPLYESREIHRSNIPAFRTHIRQLPLNPRRDFLVRRVLLALEHLEARGNAQQVGSVLQAQSDIDSARVDSSYTMLHVFIWAVPILGFIGTVVGISDAVNQFSGSLQGAEDLDVIKQSLAGVTTGLAVAFDTTLVALLMSMVIMFPSNSLQKAEQDLLNSIDQYCNDHLLQRLSDGVETATSASRNGDLALPSLQAWQESVEQTGARFVQQVRELLESAQGSFAGEISGPNGSTPGGAPMQAALSGRFTLRSGPIANLPPEREHRLETAITMLTDLMSRQQRPGDMPAGPTAATTPPPVS